VRRYVASLRAAVGPVVTGRILTRDPGYVCQAAEDEAVACLPACDDYP
jgi:hypothetical protein